MDWITNSYVAETSLATRNCTTCCVLNSCLTLPKACLA